MRHLIDMVWQARFWTDSHGQDLIEYALMAGFVAVAAGALLPNVSTSISSIFTSVQSSLANASSS